MLSYPNWWPEKLVSIINKEIEALNIENKQVIFEDYLLPYPLRGFTSIENDIITCLINKELYKDCRAYTSVVFHELKHAEQMATGRLEKITPKTICWEGNTYDKVETNYKKTPWELEADEYAKDILNKLYNYEYIKEFME